MSKASLEGNLSLPFLRGLSAYQEAVQSGFVGTRDEWIESLHGKQVELRENGFAIEWKYQGDDDWTELIRLEPVRDYEGLANRPTFDDEVLEGELHDVIISDKTAISSQKIDSVCTYNQGHLESDKIVNGTTLEYFWNLLKNLLFNKVDKVPGKDLSSNDYTTTEKNKLASIENGANANTINVIKVNGKEVDPIGKIINLIIPTKTSNIQNDLNYVSDALYVHTDNNFTSQEKTKLGSVETNAEENVITRIYVNDDPLTIDGKAVYIVIPTKVSQIDNDLNFARDPVYVHTDNNFTNALKIKLDGVEQGANVNVIDTIRVNGKDAPIVNKMVSLIIPTKASGIQNDMNYVSDANYIHSDNNFSNIDKSHLDILWEHYNG